MSEKYWNAIKISEEQKNALLAAENHDYQNRDETGASIEENVPTIILAREFSNGEQLRFRARFKWTTEYDARVWLWNYLVNDHKLAVSFDMTEASQVGDYENDWVEVSIVFDL